MECWGLHPGSNHKGHGMLGLGSWQQSAAPGYWDFDPGAVNSSCTLGLGPCKGQRHIDIVLLTLQRPRTFGYWCLHLAKAKGLWILGFEPCKGQGPLDIGFLTLPRPRAFGHWGLSPAKTKGLWSLLFPHFLWKGQMETRRGARGLSHQGRSSRAPEVLVDNRDSMANSNICTDNPGNILSTLTSTDKPHPCEFVWEAAENCVRVWQHFHQREKRTQRIRSQYQLIDSLLEEIRSDCANLEKFREMLLQCTGIPEPGALRLHQQNTKQRKEASAQEEKAEQQDWMEVSQEEEPSSWTLEQLSWESSDQGHAAAQACREEELLGQKAELEGRLAATEWLQQDLSRQLAETRSAKESLESRLLAAQQQIAQLEMSRKRVEAELQAELQKARSEVQEAQRRHEQEQQGLKEEMNLLLEQREALQKQVAELTSQLAASRECQEKTVQRAQQDVREAQEESRQKLSEVEHVQKLLEEAEHQKKELQAHLQDMEREWIQWEEVAQQNSELQASVNALEREKAR
ncbi:rootletin-like [Passer domesticus]|uniref:rootletin-like n=1 Tax=Passer domesticus TaxID=48849 RepID=UPI0030FEF3EC